MGTFTHPLTPRFASGNTAETREAPVDTGAIITSVPVPTLDRLGIAPHRTVKLRLSRGQIE